MKVKSLMTKPVVTVRRKVSVKEAVKKMAKKSISCVIIAEKKIPIGIFTKYDLLSLLDTGADLNKILIESAMRTPVMPISENSSFFDTARQMDQMEVRRFVIVDRSQKLTGIITETDVVRNFAVTSFSYRMSLAAVAVEGFTATPKTPLKKIAHMMIDGRRSCVTIVKNSKPEGIVTQALLVKLAARYREPLKGNADSRMTKNITASSIESSVREIVMLMAKKELRHVVTVDERGRFTGTVSQRELVRHIERSRL
ncbi:MAG: CBS domain-containing protein [Nitrospinota bacterium]